MHTQVARRQVALVLVPLETHPKIRILEQVMSLGDAFCRGRIESFQRDRKGAKKRCISRKIKGALSCWRTPQAYGELSELSCLRMRELGYLYSSSYGS